MFQNERGSSPLFSESAFSRCTSVDCSQKEESSKNSGYAEHVVTLAERTRDVHARLPEQDCSMELQLAPVSRPPLHTWPKCPHN